MARDVPVRGPARLLPTAASEAAARAAAGSAATLLRLAEATTLAAAAGVRSVVDLTRSSPRPERQQAARPLPTGIGEGEVAAPDAPPVPHWDELNLARIRGRLPRLSLEELRSLLAYEHAHAGRLPVLTMLGNRISKIEDQSTEGGTDVLHTPDEQERQGRSED